MKTYNTIRVISRTQDIGFLITWTMRIVFIFLLGYSLFNAFPMLEDGKQLLSIGFFANSYLIWTSRKFKAAFIMFIFWFTYILVTANYYYNDVDISGGYNTFDKLLLYNETLRIHIVFLLSCAITYPRIKRHVYIRERLRINSNSVMAVLTLIFGIIIAIYGTRGGTILQSGYGNMGTSNLGSTSVTEYFLVLIPLLYFLTKGKTILRFSFWCLLCYFIIKNLLMGDRNKFVEIALLFIILLDSKKISIIKLFTAGAIPVYLLAIFGVIRTNPLLLFSESLNQILLAPFKNIYSILGNQADVFYASVRINGMIGIKEITAADRLYSFFYNILALFVPFSFLPDIANLAAYKQNVYGAAGGGLISTFWYTFLGMPGVIFIGAIISQLIRWLLTSRNTFFILFMVMAFTTYPRWFAYNQISLWKIDLYIVFYYATLIGIGILVRKLVKNSAQPAFQN